MKVIRLTLILTLILVGFLSPTVVNVHSVDFEVFDGVYLEARTLGALYPLRVDVLQQTILMREGEVHNITFYSYGYKPLNLSYIPISNGNLIFVLEPTSMYTFDVIAPNYPDLPMGIYKVIGSKLEFTGVTSLNGKAYFYAPFNNGDEISFYASPPQDILFWMKFLNASRYEPFLIEVRERFSGYMYAVPLVPTPLIEGVDSDYTNYTVTDESIQGKTLLMGSSRVLEGYVKTASGEPLENAIVAIKPERFYRYLFAFTDKNGYYRFDNYVGPGRYSITVIYRGYIHPTQTLFIFTQDRMYNITTPDLIIVEGYYKDLNGNPLPNAQLVFIGSQYLSLAYTDEDGYYSLAVEAGAGEYLILQKWNGLGLRDIEIGEAQLIDGFENLTAALETALITGRVYDPVNDVFIDNPIIRFTGTVSGLPINVTIDKRVLDDGSFGVRIPIRVNLMGVYRDISWNVLMADYYYSGNLLVSNEVFISDGDLGSYAITPPNLVEIAVDVTISSTPPSIPIDTYLFSLWYGNNIFNITIQTNSTFKSHTPGAFILSEDFNGLIIKAVTPLSMTSSMDISIPKDLMSGTFAVTVNDQPWSYELVGEDVSTITIRIMLEGGDNIVKISSTRVIYEFESIYILIAFIAFIAILSIWKRFRIGI